MAILVGPRGRDYPNLVSISICEASLGQVDRITQPFLRTGHYYCYLEQIWFLFTLHRDFITGRRSE